MERGKGSKRNEVGNGGGIGNFGEGTKKREGKKERKKGYFGSIQVTRRKEANWR